MQQQRETSRVDQLELQLQSLAEQTEVTRLQEALQEVRKQVEDLSERFTVVSAQVREEVRVLLYGNQLTVGGGASGDDSAPPQPLLQWLQQHYEVREMVQDALRIFSQDRTGRADYALGAASSAPDALRPTRPRRRCSVCSDFPLVPRAPAPSYRGSSGVLVLRLSMSVSPSSFSLEHVPRSLSPSGSSSSAPRDFRVYGLQDEEEEEGKLGSFRYDQTESSADEQNGSWFQVVELQVLSNWGNPEYTCLYRFRVHGSPADTQH
ncbi:hypothetical protein F7725_013723 [Dissostichus mawsoni]|uniref:SUN domain-containing protein n=1 Tax=Dissostichus mawsoni TaxID=36200 RepID=A0A7J5YU73_DISMA|nr:hypothetical protein F7725_013723 [Dissostichus mawsoni]